VVPDWERKPVVLILPSDVWTPLSGRSYELAPGVYNAILFPTSIRNVSIRAQRLGSVWIRPQAPYECGVYCDDRYPCENIYLWGLDVAECARDGIRFWGSRGIIIDRCKSHHNVWNGIALHRNADSMVISSIVRDNGIQGTNMRHGLYVGGHRINVLNNLFVNNSGFGIHFWDTPALASNCVISGNRVINHPSYGGIVVRRPDGDIRGLNVITDNQIIAARNCLQLDGGGNDQVHRNICTGTMTWMLVAQNMHGRVWTSGNTGGPTFDPANLCVVES
jgi:hypothetical protein